MFRRLFLILLIFSLTACEKKVTVKATFSGEKSLSQDFILKVSDTPKLREHGLMHVREMPANEGMIFVFPKEEQQGFWMKNTYISLDMIFVDANLKIVGILDNVPILNEAPRSVAAKSLYVIELIAGSCQKHGIKVGDTVKLDHPLKAKY